MCSKCNLISSNKISCSCYRNKKMFLKINGKDIKYNLIRNKFKLIKGILIPLFLIFV